MGRSSGHKKNRPLVSGLVIVVIIIGIIVLGLMYLYQKNETAKINAELAELVEEDAAEAESQEAELEALIADIEANYSFYEKLSAGYDVNILLIGDAFATGSGSSGSDARWYNLLADDLEADYMDGTDFDGDVVVTSIAMSGATAYSGYVRLVGLDDDTDYDLVIICIGQNDEEEDFALYYEALIRAAESRYEGCEIIAVLESNELNYMDISYMDEESTNELTDESYTAKLTAIKTLADYYGIQVADMPEAYVNSGYEYEDLTSDGTYPNDDGHQIYADTIEAVIAENVSAATGKTQTPSAYNEEVSVYDNFAWFGIEGDDGETVFTQDDDLTYTLTLSDSDAVGETCVLGLDLTWEYGDNIVYVYVDDVLYTTIEYSRDSGSSYRCVVLAGEDFAPGSEIKIVYEDEDAAAGFYGIALSWE